MIPYKSNRLKDINKAEERETCVHIRDLFIISVTMNEIKVSVPAFLVLNQRTIHHVVCQSHVRELRFYGALCH